MCGLEFLGTRKSVVLCNLIRQFCTPMDILRIRCYTVSPTERPDFISLSSFNSANSIVLFHPTHCRSEKAHSTPMNAMRQNKGSEDYTSSLRFSNHFQKGAPIQNQYRSRLPNRTASQRTSDTNESFFIFNVPHIDLFVKFLMFF